MNLNFLDFEQPIAEIQAKIEELRHVGTDTKVNLLEEIERLEQKSKELTKSIFSSLNAQQIVQLARHPQRPHSIDYFASIFTEFDELQGDRHFAKGATIVGGIARLDGESVMIIGHQKGRSTKENLARNFGMPKPEDYRKALRLMQMAEKFHLPILTFIDTPGAYPGIGAEERNQSEAIARNLLAMSQLKTPIICTIIGEGGSGGALAIGVGDRTIMFQYSIYSVISPEGCASILWKNAEKTPEAAEALGLTAERLQQLKLIDYVLEEPLGGAHSSPNEMAENLKNVLIKELKVLQRFNNDELLTKRYERLMSYGL